jgi:hypothetical protein
LKRCPACGVLKRRDGFYRERNRRDGLSYLCKVCRKAETSAYRATLGAAEKNRARVKRYEQGAGRQRKNARVAAWKRAHPDRLRAARHVYRARRAGAPMDRETVEFMYVLLGDPCAYCGGPAGSVDHIVPLALGGDSMSANLIAACRSCNSSKRAKPLLLWLAERGT